MFCILLTKQKKVPKELTYHPLVIARRLGLKVPSDRKELSFLRNTPRLVSSLEGVLLALEQTRKIIMRIWIAYDFIITFTIVVFNFKKSRDKR